MAKKTQKFTAQLHWKRYGSSAEGEFSVFISDMSQYGYVLVGEPQEFEYTIPANFDPVAGQLRALDKEETRLRAEFAKRITELQRIRNELLALENNPSEGDAS